MPNLGGPGVLGNGGEMMPINSEKSIADGCNFLPVFSKPTFTVKVMDSYIFPLTKPSEPTNVILVVSPEKAGPSIPRSIINKCLY